MVSRNFYLARLAALFLVLHFASGSEEYLDMSYPFDENTIYWPTALPFSFEILFRNYTEDFYYEANNFCAAEHGGTHIDAPAHFAEGNWRVDEIPLDTLIGPAVRIDISAKSQLDPDATLQVEDLTNWEKENGEIPDDSILMVYSGWGSHWLNKTLYLGTDTIDTSLLHFPGISPEAAQWVVENRKVKTVGIDTASIDFGQSTTFETHQIFYSQNIPGLENVANLDQLPTKGATVYALPMKIRDGSGAPCRIFAVLPEENQSDSANIVITNIVLTTTFSFCIFLFFKSD